MKRLLLIGWLASFGAAAQFNQVELCDKAIAGRCATVDASGNLGVNATVNVAGAADLPGNTATFNANNVCTSVLTAGEQSVGFHLDSGTLAATLTAFGTQAIGAVNCASAGTCTALTFSSGSTIVVTNPNGVKDVGVVAQPGMRQVQVCTGSSGTTGSATGVVTATYLNATSSGGGGTVTQGTPNSAANAWPVTETFSGALIDPRAIRALTVADIVGLGAGSALVGKFGIDQTTPGTTNGVVINNAASVQGLGLVGAGSGGWQNVQGDPSMTPLQVANKATAPLFANAADNFAVAATLNAACTTTTACSAASSIQWAVNGAQSGEATITAISSPVGITVACDKSYDGGTTYLLAVCDLWQKGVYKTGSLANGDLAASTQWVVYFTGAPSHIRIRISVYTSGSFTVAGRSVFAPSWPFPVEAKTTTQNAVTLTASTAETTLLAAGGAGVFLDLTEIACTNSSTSSSLITVRDATAGSLRIPISCPAAVGPCEGFVFAKVPWRQTTANNNWTIQSSASASSYICTAQAVPR